MVKEMPVMVKEMIKIESFKQQNSQIVSVLRYKKGLILMFFIKSKCFVFIHLADIKYFKLLQHQILFLHRDV